MRKLSTFIILLVTIVTFSEAKQTFKSTEIDKYWYDYYLIRHDTSFSLNTTISIFDTFCAVEQENAPNILFKISRMRKLYDGTEYAGYLQNSSVWVSMLVRNKRDRVVLSILKNGYVKIEEVTYFGKFINE
jgi:hypothetical protein